MSITVNHVHSGTVTLQSDGQAQIVGLLNQLLAKVNDMATLDDLKAAMANEDTKIAALIQAYKDLVAQVAANVNDPAALQALVDDANAQSTAMDAANPPAAPSTGTVTPPAAA